MSDAAGRDAAACLLPGFVGLDVPEWLRRWLDEGLGGVVLFARNISDRDQLAALTAELRRDRPELVVALDEEGGDVTRLEAAGGSSYPGNHALGAVDDLELTRRVAAAMGSDLADAGVNFDLAPVADVNSNPDNPVIGVRAFGDDPSLVARHVAAFVDGLQRAGVAACAKHFPGHGDTALDSHLDAPVVTADRATLAERELVPFRAAIEAGVRAVMTAHVTVPALAPGPATLSPAVIDHLLRGELGFEGMVVTDALEMRAISATVGIEAGALGALAAGADALCLGSEGGEQIVAGVHAALAEGVRSGQLSEERLAEAAARVAKAGAWSREASRRAPEGREVGMEAARRALRADGDVVLSRRPLVVELPSEASIAAGPARHGLADSLAGRGQRPVVASSPERAAGIGELLSRAGDRQVVVVVRDAHRDPWQREAVDSLLRAAQDAVVVETGVPVWRPASAAGYISTHGRGRANLDAAAERLVGAP